VRESQSCSALEIYSRRQFDVKFLAINNFSHPTEPSPNPARKAFAHPLDSIKTYCRGVAEEVEDRVEFKDAEQEAEQVALRDHTEPKCA